MHEPLELTDPAPSLQASPLSPFEQRVLNHWRQFRPNLVTDLQRANRLEQEVRDVVWKTEGQRVRWKADGLHDDQIDELVKDQLWTPEPGSTTPSQVTKLSSPAAPKRGSTPILPR